MGVALSSGQGEAVPRPSPGNCLWPLMWAVTSVSMSTRGHSHMRGLVPQDGLFGGSGTGGGDGRAGGAGGGGLGRRGGLAPPPPPPPPGFPKGGGGGGGGGAPPRAGSR